MRKNLIITFFLKKETQHFQSLNHFYCFSLTYMPAKQMFPVYRTTSFVSQKLHCAILPKRHKSFVYLLRGLISPHYPLIIVKIKFFNKHTCFIN